MTLRLVDLNLQEFKPFQTRQCPPLPLSFTAPVCLVSDWHAGMICPGLMSILAAFCVIFSLSEASSSIRVAGEINLPTLISTSCFLSNMDVFSCRIFLLFLCRGLIQWPQDD